VATAAVTAQLAAMPPNSRMRLDDSFIARPLP
jgi:hypothetical protein